MIKMNIDNSSITTQPAQAERFYSKMGGRIERLKRSARVLLLAILTSFFGTFAVSADTAGLVDGHPDRYTVVDGDTLWGISSRFLSDPWRWPEVWKGNPEVENPDLIYPGDVLVLSFIDGRPSLRALRRETVKLSPEPRATSFLDAIPPIDPSAIEAYINSPLVTNTKELEQAGYIVQGKDNRLVAGKYDQVYARAVAEDADSFRVFRPGRTFVDPVSKEALGFEAVHVGDANMLRRGDDVSRLVLTKTYTDAGVRDRLRPIYEEQALPFFYPKAPDNDELRGMILITENEATELGAMSVVAVNLGEREGVSAGDVFRILSQKQTRKDPFNGESYEIPEEKIGLALVFRTFEKVSYALITDTSQQVTPGDIFISPKK